MMKTEKLTVTVDKEIKKAIVKKYKKERKTISKEINHFLEQELKRKNK